AWESKGFCGQHGLDNRDPLNDLPPGLIACGREVLNAVLQFIVKVSNQVVDMSSLDPSHVWEELAASGAVSASNPASLVLYNGELLSADEMIRWLQDIVHLNSGQARGKAQQLLAGEDAEVTNGSDLDEVLMMGRALVEKGAMVGVQTPLLRKKLLRAAQLVRWLRDVSQVSDGTCRLVCECFDAVTLSRLILTDAFLPQYLNKDAHDLYLTLMADQPFKTRLATAYVETLLPVTQSYAKGFGVAETSMYSLSVQFLNRSTFVNELVAEHRLLETLVNCLLTTLTPGMKS
ncbi:unnamed protein product, partial [Chrysoparadoxa australica]